MELYQEHFGSAYCASKHAIEGLSSALWHEIKSFCRVITVELSFFKGTEISKNKTQKSSIKEYEKVPILPLKIKIKQDNDIQIAVKHIIEEADKKKSIFSRIASYLTGNTGTDNQPSLLSRITSYFNADGSHAIGLDSVPFDGYKAILHKGEAVLTSKQAELWNSIQDGSALMTVRDRIDNVINEAISEGQNTLSKASNVMTHVRQLPEASSNVLREVMNNTTTTDIVNAGNNTKEIIDIVRWAVSRIERKFDEMESTTNNYSISNVSTQARKKGRKSMTDTVFAF